MTSELGRRLARRLAVTGPISVADFMAEALGHPTLGYYRRAMPLGAAGDFTTAPEISQMFGELLGAWLAERWYAIGRPAPVRLIELGPGRGTLMADALRATRGVPGFHAAVDLHLVDINQPLRAAQEAALGAYRPHWHDRIDTIPVGPTLLVANEFFDALPVRQFEKTRFGWSERMVGLAPDGETLVFAAAPGPSPFARLLPDVVREADLPLGTIAETCPGAIDVITQIATRLVTESGWALIIDYGRDHSEAIATLQAVRGHRSVDPLDRPGETDLTAHVDFAVLAATARAAGAQVFGPTGQGDFLRRLGLEQRTAALKARATPAQRSDIDAASLRLIAPDQMGTLFRVLAVGDTRSPAPAGFSDET
ncbi:NADH dehydrogenase [ubiquinone] 1 alpha subcomplex assembly factor 7 [Enhydrobacter aerosaccus]|uniref:NADH dehydrogenase [ubiquinone] 1 alpha subcomplex assembly factor 7 n=1 Tax=Enhydrobacter aerosaccus TaxID=225324 RepID=A0A1T4PA39_9HYPH|nr:SAM-dependent methyltransferase [Enhydrobacter aerosaccus]SJZ88394.1 NADH dehydrogenase [ubiquinone] 1 alpha subcomplex assembly factor 7 [Enhydrobacter aerosaccus]